MCCIERIASQGGLKKSKKKDDVLPAGIGIRALAFLLFIYLFIYLKSN